jgi:hypothetical protein
MIERILPDGTVVEFPDTMTESEIERVIAEYLGTTATEALTEEEGSGGQSQQPIRRPSAGPGYSVCQGSSPAPPPEPEPVVPNLRLVTVMPYAAEHEPTPEQAREVAQRLGRPPRREPPDEYSADDRFRDNMHHRWSRMYWRP